MKPILSSILAALIVASFAVPGVAHHGTSITYEMDKTITVSGTVTEFDFSYPHPSLFFDVKDDKGQVVKWGAEFLPTPAALKNAGWTKETIKFNDKVVLGCHPSKSGKPVCALASLSINGKAINVGGGPGVAPAPGAGGAPRGPRGAAPTAPAGAPRGQRQ
ncbi:MAG TPA: DUF6152 family protein [Terriglobia bacterium]|nr:DUF6152 family protein [Terriglobia bacterium]